MKENENIFIRGSFNSETYYKTPYQPERGLLLAILLRAIMDLTDVSLGREKSKVNHDKRKLIVWLEKRFKKKSRLWSFQWICEQLDLDPDIMEAQIKKKSMEITRPINI